MVYKSFPFKGFIFFKRQMTKPGSVQENYSEIFPEGRVMHVSWNHTPEAYSEPRQISKIKLFEKIIHS